MKISELANECGYEFCGEDREVNSILYSYCAEEDSIAIVVASLIFFDYTPNP